MAEIPILALLDGFRASLLQTQEGAEIMRLNSKMLHKIGMSALSPNWLKMWCLRGIFLNIQRSIENLPADQRARFDEVATKKGRMRA